MKNKLILYDIFSYSCMNCLRSAEYIKQIDTKYKKYGLETIILHPPEWEFEKESKNISANLKQNNIPFPFIPDIERKRIHEFGINFWPTQLLVQNRKVLYKHIGEGNYKELEENIIEILELKQKALKKIFTQEPIYTKYPTVYCGTRKKGLVVNSSSFPRRSSTPRSLRLEERESKNRIEFGTIYTKDPWQQEQEFLRSTSDNQSITILTKGNIINFVAESLTGKQIKISVQINDSSTKNLTINKPRLYKLVELRTNLPQKLTLNTQKQLAIYAFSFE